MDLSIAEAIFAKVRIVTRSTMKRRREGLDRVIKEERSISARECLVLL